MAALRIVFMGTPAFAALALKALVDAGHDVIAVYSQPPRPKGRGMDTQKSPVHLLAEEQGIAVRTPVSLRNADEIATFQALNADVAVVAAYGLILPKGVLDAPRYGCLNIHASLLPRWRGAAPIQRAIMAGDKETGVTIMHMEERLDTGPTLLKGSMPIGQDMNAGALHDALAEIGARLICTALDQLPGGLKPVPQPAEGVTYAAKITKEECRIDWRRSAAELDRHIRGLSPTPGAYIQIQGERLTILAAEIVPSQSGTPGTTLDDRLTIACGESALRPTLVKRAGKRAMSTDEMLRGFAVPKGTALS
ncbi:methionyl-tRNA formyltransferase [Dongia deserti]|uniref:methionyl-tRNA formyltransferase n=1 Tax=Dongia deserti TaxID=2268030 RepID=UPI000E650D28|nr:methionyl-tRNA formyltransferase [Dongia deserti]